MIAVGAAHRGRKGPTPYAKAIWQGYRRGQAAKWLLGEDYERLMAEPLDAARKRLGITPATVYDSIPPEVRDQSLPSRRPWGDHARRGSSADVHLHTVAVDPHLHPARRLVEAEVHPLVADP